MVLALVRHPVVFAILSFGLLALVVGHISPPPRDWFHDESERHSDVHVSIPLTWHPILNKWTLGAPSVTLTDAHWLNAKAWATNALSVGFSTSHPIMFTLGADGALVQERVGHTGFATPITDTSTETIVFRNIPAGAYTLRVQIHDDAGNTIDELATELRIIPEASS